MSVIVFSKRTGKYLKRHSGSFNRLVSMLSFKSGISDKIREELGQCPGWDNGSGLKKQYKWRVKSYKIREDSVFNAEPGDARVYHSESSATSSVGIWDKDPGSKRTYKLPDHMEIHEIKEAFVCVMRPDGSSNCDEGDGDD